MTHIYLAIIEHWTVPGVHMKAFASRVVAELWALGQFNEDLLPDINDYLEDDERTTIKPVDSFAKAAKLVRDHNEEHDKAGVIRIDTVEFVA